MIAFYGIYFLKLFNQRKRGIQTNQLGKGKRGFLKFIEVALRDVTYLVPLIEAISILRNTYLDFVWLRITGITLGVLGVTIFAVTVFTMRDSWRAGVSKDENTVLVTSGIYAFSRNPAFLGFDLIYIEILALFFNASLLIVTLLVIVLLHLHFQIHKQKDLDF